MKLTIVTTFYRIFSLFFLQQNEQVPGRNTSTAKDSKNHVEKVEEIKPFTQRQTHHKAPEDTGYKTADGFGPKTAPHADGNPSQEQIEELKNLCKKLEDLLRKEVFLDNSPGVILARPIIEHVSSEIKRILHPKPEDRRYPIRVTSTTKKENKMLFDCQVFIGYVFENIKYLRQALNVDESMDNMKLAMIGDHIQKLLLCEVILRGSEQSTRGFIQENLHAKVGTNNHQARMALEVGGPRALSQYLIYRSDSAKGTCSRALHEVDTVKPASWSNGLDDKNPADSTEGIGSEVLIYEKRFADAMEAVLGAIYEDCRDSGRDLKETMQVLIKVLQRFKLDNEAAAELNENDNDETDKERRDRLQYTEMRAALRQNHKELAKLGLTSSGEQEMRRANSI